MTKEAAMKCKCSGLMVPRQLTCDTVAHVCVNCGRDNLPRRAPGADDITHGPKPVVDTAKKPLWETPRTCPGCGRPGLIFTGKCGRCSARKKHGLDLVTGRPVATTSAAAPLPQKPAPAPKAPAAVNSGTCPLCHRLDQKLKPTGRCGRCDYRLYHGINLLLPNQKPGIAAPRQ